MFLHLLPNRRKHRITAEPMELGEGQGAHLTFFIVMKVKPSYLTGHKVSFTHHYTQSYIALVTHDQTFVYDFCVESIYKTQKF